eukprot:XP_001701747.1 predicted protein [Chlamydomonas reinhardtii]
MPGLRAIASLGAGVDHAMRPGLIPPGVEILRIVDPLMAQRMATWVMWAVVNFQRKMDLYARAQAERRYALGSWEDGYSAAAHLTWQVRVGIMGYGVMGQAAAGLLRAAGYDVAAWARSPHDSADIKVFSGRESLRSFVERTDVLVCLLPLTAETEGIISAQLLTWLPRGAGVVNAARGKHLDEAALLAAIDSGHVAGAVLDVFATEPLPADSPLWAHPKIRITPHVSSITDVPNAVAQITENYQRLVAGEPLLRVANKSVGY